MDRKVGFGNADDKDRPPYTLGLIEGRKLRNVTTIFSNLSFLLAAWTRRLLLIFRRIRVLLLQTGDEDVRLGNTQQRRMGWVGRIKARRSGQIYNCKFLCC